jgi:hypothetical protein
VIWLYGLDDFLRVAREVPDLLCAIWIKAFMAWAGAGVAKYRELCRLPGTASAHEGELPREVIEARAKVMDYIADHYAKSHRRGTVNFHAPDVVSVLRIDLMGRAVRLTVKEDINFVPKRAKVLTCPVELFLGPLHGGLRAH